MSERHGGARSDCALGFQLLKKEGVLERGVLPRRPATSAAS